MRRLLSILLWSAISAAFIGPGTVTTAARAGAGYEYALLWALLFSTVACLSLQEASARLTIVSGRSLARVLGDLFPDSRFGRLLPVGVVIAVVLGCAAYQAGNILGAVSGVSLELQFHRAWVTSAVGVVALALLFAGSAGVVARLLGVVVALLGIAFLACAINLAPATAPLLKGSLLPTLPEGSGLLALGLVGTTVVPYNLFLGSGLARGQSLDQARFGLAVAVPLGGIISMAVLVAGTAIEGDFSFPALATALGDRLGTWAATFFAFGLFAAGLSSAITAPLAAAVSVQGVMPEQRREQWSESTWRYRSVWLGVLFFGLAFGLADIKPVPVIILAQALNGMVLPLVAVLLWMAVNDRRIMGDGIARLPANVFLAFSVLLAFLLGTSGILRVVFRLMPDREFSELHPVMGAAVLALLLAYPVVREIGRRRRGG